MRVSLHRALIVVAVLVVVLTAARRVSAQAPATSPSGVSTAPASVAAAARAEATSPRAAFQAFRQACHAGRWADAAQFLSLDETTRSRGPELARKLNAVIESLFTLDPDSISGSAAGRLDDGLPPDIEQIAQVERVNAPEPIRLGRVAADPHPYWAFTPATVERVDRWYRGLYSRWLRERLVAMGLSGLVREGPLDIYYWQWLAFPLIALVAWLFGRGLDATARPLVALVTRRTRSRWDDRVAEALGPPFTLAFTVLVFTTLSVFTDLNRESFWLLRALVRPVLTFAAFWAIWRISAIALAWATSQNWALSSASARNLLAIGTNISRALIIGVGAVAMLAAAGIPVGTVLAGLGIGGLALAFGAQKTVENLFGSVALALDQPIRVGDFVKVQDFVGTVEDIGVRSTRIRTPDRTLVSIPNGKLADERLESYELRDRMRLTATVGLTYDTTRAQMLAIIEGFEQALRSHPQIWPDGITVRFATLGASSLDIEVMAWFAVPTWADFQQCRQDVLLAFMAIVEGAGASFAFPTRTVHIASAETLKAP